MRMGRAAALLAALAALAVATSTVGASGAAATSRRASATVTLLIYAAQHGREAVVSPNFAVEPGVPVTVRFVNYTREWHTFTVPGLNVGAMIAPRQGVAPRVTLVRFTASKFGVFDWYCVLCRAGVHRGVHQMGGKVYAIIGERWPQSP